MRSLSVPSKLLELHRVYNDSISWQLCDDGVSVEQSGVERTPGDPVTARRIWDSYSGQINSSAERWNIPTELIIATICTESRGDPAAVRKEPGYESAITTPGRISVGLMQTLVSTASSMFSRYGVGSFSPEDIIVMLMNPIWSIRAGSLYIYHQRYRTSLDPPVVAAAYNAGGCYYQGSPENRWKLRQYPLGTSEHVDRFVKWFNDAVYMLRDHPTQPSVVMIPPVGEECCS